MGVTFLTGLAVGGTRTTTATADPGASSQGEGKPHRGAAQREEMYFSRRICGTGRPNSFSAAKAASTMLGLPHR